MDVRQVQQSNEAAARRTANVQAPTPQKQSHKKKLWLKIVVVVVIIVVIAAVVVGALKWRNRGDEARINKSEYQAVFLTNGQVYFGKLSKVDNSYLDLKDIYYLQVQQPVQPSSNNQDQKTQLVKLGNELHGPEDDMQISGKQVLFWENLKNDGKVAQAIKSYQSK